MFPKTRPHSLADRGVAAGERARTQPVLFANPNHKEQQVDPIALQTTRKNPEATEKFLHSDYKQRREEHKVHHAGKRTGNNIASRPIFDKSGVQIGIVDDIDPHHHGIYYASDHMASCLQHDAPVPEETDPHAKGRKTFIEKHGLAAGICQRQAHDQAHRRIRRGVDGNWHTTNNPILEAWRDEEEEQGGIDYMSHHGKKHYGSAAVDHVEFGASGPVPHDHTEKKHYSNTSRQMADHINFKDTVGGPNDLDHLERKHFLGDRATAMVDHVHFGEAGKNDVDHAERKHNFQAAGERISAVPDYSSFHNRFSNSHDDPAIAKESAQMLKQRGGKRGMGRYPHLQHSIDVHSHHDGVPEKDFLGPHKGAQVGGSRENYEKILQKDSGAAYKNLQQETMFGHRTKVSDYIPGCHGGERGRRHFDVYSETGDTLQHRQEGRDEGVFNGTQNDGGQPLSAEEAELEQEGLDHHHAHLDDFLAAQRHNKSVYNRMSGYDSRKKLPAGARPQDQDEAVHYRNSDGGKQALLPFPLAGALNGAAPGPNGEGDGRFAPSSRTTTTQIPAALQERAKHEYQATNECFRENQARASLGNLFRKNYPEQLKTEPRYQEAYHRPDAGHTENRHLPGHPPAREPLGVFPHWQQGGKRHGWAVTDYPETFTTDPRQHHLNTKVRYGTNAGADALHKHVSGGSLTQTQRMNASASTSTRTNGNGNYENKPADPVQSEYNSLAQKQQAADQAASQQRLDRVMRLPLHTRNQLGKMRSFLLRPSSLHQRHNPVMEFGRLARSLRQDDPEDSGLLPQAVAQSNLRQCFPPSEFSATDLNRVSSAFSVGQRTEADGFQEQFVDYEALLVALRPQLMPVAKKILEETFDRLLPQLPTGNSSSSKSTTSRQYLTLPEVKSYFHPRHDPRVTSEQLSALAVRDEFLQSFDGVDDRTGILTKDRFVQYYTIHAELFGEKELKRTLDAVWIRTPEIHPNCLQPHIIDIEFHDEGEVVPIALVNDLGLNRGSVTELVGRLRRQGVERDTGRKILKVFPVGSLS
ncbi:unnamed protein product [Amoebophrya sp. A120]|nr:unnamed protein product [Amoebophrya sp. A120]|eukprot:GSA120T00011104001.1